MRFAGFNCDIEIEALGPVDPKEIPETVSQIREEGAHFLRTPPVNMRFPFYSMGRDAMRKQAEAAAEAAASSDADAACST